ncbi:hypothetical protein PR048_011039 [Dryococelus australis]|uniref:Uncharacterized protein n=1 Tax=Dryococelus australis TaxID=614101 RepID=A0ABQ9HLR3_9NEOP|nr:hypothetical protein PR048_011039 [Dryococelus australis]
MVTMNDQLQFSLSLWAAIIGDRFVEPFILPQCLTGEAYLHLLWVTLPSLLEEVPLVVQIVMWLLHGDAPAYFCITMQRHLDNVLPGRWIRQSGPVA